MPLETKLIAEYFQYDNMLEVLMKLLRELTIKFTQCVILNACIVLTDTLRAARLLSTSSKSTERGVCASHVSVLASKRRVCASHVSVLASRSSVTKPHNGTRNMAQVILERFMRVF